MPVNLSAPDPRALHPVACVALGIAEAEDFFLAFPAIDALAEIGDSQIVNRLAPLLKSEMLRTAVVEALAKLGAEQAAPALAELLGTDGPHILPVAQALSNAHDAVEKQLGEGNHLIDLVRRYAPAEASQVLIRSLNKTDTSQLRPLVRVLGWMQDESAPLALTGLLGEKTWWKYSSLRPPRDGATHSAARTPRFRSAPGGDHGARTCG